MRYLFLAAAILAATPAAAQLLWEDRQTELHNGLRGPQFNTGRANRYCAGGTVYQPAPNGWRCVPASRHH